MVVLPSKHHVSGPIREAWTAVARPILRDVVENQGLALSNPDRLGEWMQEPEEGVDLLDAVIYLTLPALLLRVGAG